MFFQALSERMSNAKATREVERARKQTKVAKNNSRLQALDTNKKRLLGILFFNL